MQNFLKMDRFTNKLVHIQKTWLRSSIEVILVTMSWNRRWEVPSKIMGFIIRMWVVVGCWSCNSNLTPSSLWTALKRMQKGNEYSFSRLLNGWCVNNSSLASSALLTVRSQPFLNVMCVVFNHFHEKFRNKKKLAQD